MNRCLAFLFALLFASLSVASACTAQGGDWIRFTLEARQGSDQLQASFDDESRGRDRDNDWSTGLAPSQLIGLDLSGFRADGSRPLSFALAREAGRLDCVGHGGRSVASGQCRFSPDAAFVQLLESRGIGRPNR